jgi:hypothetical protein
VPVLQKMLLISISWLPILFHILPQLIVWNNMEKFRAYFSIVAASITCPIVAAATGATLIGDTTAAVVGAATAALSGHILGKFIDAAIKAVAPGSEALALFPIALIAPPAGATALGALAALKAVSWLGLH